MCCTNETMLRWAQSKQSRESFIHFHGKLISSTSRRKMWIFVRQMQTRIASTRSVSWCNELVSVQARNSQLPVEWITDKRMRTDKNRYLKRQKYETKRRRKLWANSDRQWQTLFAYCGRKKNVNKCIIRSCAHRSHRRHRRKWIEIRSLVDLCVLFLRLAIYFRLLRFAFVCLSFHVVAYAHTIGQSRTR